MQFQNNTKKNHTIVPGEVLQNDLDKANNSNALEKKFPSEASVRDESKSVPRKKSTPIVFAGQMKYSRH